LANPVYGFVDPIGGIPDREAKLQLIKSLLAHGANPNLQMTVRPPTFGGTGTGGYNDAYGATPFIVAANAADVEIMRMLLAAGADLIRRWDGNPPRSWQQPVSTGASEIIDDEERALAAVRFLLDLGVNPKAVTTYNENALFGPGYRNWNRMLELLIEAGADVNIINRAGVTPYLAASGFGDRLGGVLYNKAGADILLDGEPDAGSSVSGSNRCRPKVRPNDANNCVLRADVHGRIGRARGRDLDNPAAQQTRIAIRPRDSDGGTQTPAGELVTTYVTCHNQRTKPAVSRRQRDGTSVHPADAGELSSSREPRDAPSGRAASR
jgi:hypothetical protein